MSIVLTIVAIWFVASVPLALLVGRILAANQQQEAYAEEF